MSVTIDSTNPRVIADNIRKLDDAVQAAASELPEVETTDEGKVLTVNASGKWAALDLPPYPIGNLDYSTTEQDTGLKWIDGKEIYCKTISGDIPTLTESYNGNIEAISIDTLINSGGYLKKSGSGMYNVNCYRSSAIYSTVRYASGNVVLSCGTAFSEFSYGVTIYYTKPTENREPDGDISVTETKSTKRKTTKKEEE